MKKTVAIGRQSFEALREKDCFYIDKTDFIRQWWESEDDVTLIARPRRFGKTLNMDMLNCFFSVAYEGRADLFEGLSVWEDEEYGEKYRTLQGKFPVIFLSFADVKGRSFSSTRENMMASIMGVYRAHDYLLESDILTEDEMKAFRLFCEGINNPLREREITDAAVTRSIRDLAFYMSRYYGRKTIILLDEYDTPLQEAYVNGYWDETAAFIRSLFNSTFKTNPYLERAVMTGITRVSKESIFSDLNNLKVVTVTSDEYADCFGFTEKEVFTALDEFGMGDTKEDVKRWYDGFSFGKRRDIYNPWSILNYLDTGKLEPYWANTSGNALVSELIREGDPEIKASMEELLAGRSIKVTFDEQTVFSQLDDDDGAIWGLLCASGYLTVDSKVMDESGYDFVYEIRITNYETLRMFRRMIAGWFRTTGSNYREFKRAFLAGDVKVMNITMNRITRDIFSSFDTGTRPSEYSQPERFYHGFVLGQMVEYTGVYHITSNRESGFGRYDICMEPLKSDMPAVIIEFKVFDDYDEKSLEDTAAAALRQINEKNYDADLLARGIDKSRIKHYGFAFRGKEVLIKSE